MDLNDSKTRIQLALKKQADGTYTSLTEAAKAFEVPCSTLGHRAKRQVSNKEKAILQQKLIKVEEEALV